MNLGFDKHVPLSLFGEAAATLNESVRQVSYLDFVMNSEGESPNTTFKKKKKKESQESDPAPISNIRRGSIQVPERRMSDAASAVIGIGLHCNPKLHTLFRSPRTEEIPY
jgi:hypothetical protein